jgi:hypothetical protein
MLSNPCYMGFESKNVYERGCKKGSCILRRFILRFCNLHYYTYPMFAVKRIFIIMSKVGVFLSLFTRSILNYNWKMHIFLYNRNNSMKNNMVVRIRHQCVLYANNYGICISRRIGSRNLCSFNL